MLTIRLSRIGKKKQISYRLIISEKARDTYGKALEILGSYNPTNKKLVANAERINYWISKGSGLSDTVNNLLITNSIIKGEKRRSAKYVKPVVPEVKEAVNNAIKAPVAPEEVT
ncbi:MAG: 30S ribosomal protein S16, partial [Candidatus Falkowbacteria bacterium]|nr:30S ribosomal protein S16 [Candidatus Falkowbacteria bacterium]